MQARGGSDIHEVGVERTPGSCGSWQWLGGGARYTLRQQAGLTQCQRGSHPESNKVTAAEIQGAKNLKSFNRPMAIISGSMQTFQRSSEDRRIVTRNPSSPRRWVHPNELLWTDRGSENCPWNCRNKRWS